MEKMKYRDLLRFALNKKNRGSLVNHNFSVISSNCVGGVMLHELGLRFNTPTVNLWFSAADYLKFISNLEDYLLKELIEENSSKPYPVGRLGDILINFTHYKSFEEAYQKWNERKKRINKDNLFFIMTQTDDCTDEMVHEFGKIPVQNKVIFTAREFPDVPCAVYLRGTDIDNNSIIDLCQYKSRFTGRRYLDDFDYVAFFNRTLILDKEK